MVSPCQHQDTTIKLILQEITVVSWHLGMDSEISDLTAKTKSIHIDITGFQDQVEGVEHRLATVEARLNILPDRNKKLLYLRDKLSDLEDRSCRDNVCLFGFLEHAKDTDARAFFRDILPNFVGLTFTPLLEFQRVRRMGLSRPPIWKTVPDHSLFPLP
ncbi:hypothetical protein NDU88_004340 [Pleurodeles waltl]|uniref:Uncharacterized protein n=1 Tax=Pleurodeles waltl TaxID=8319 RepID=A0AAV7V2S1_PLEWA|nr:hypothetical protein NDU88_004340 [Pleurodeles waltl]